MDVLIESTRSFENDLGRLNDDEKAMTISTINDCASLFPTQKVEVYRKLHQFSLSSELNGYESSLYTLEVSQRLRAILAVDEDPIFGQVIFTLFRLVNPDDLDKAYQNTAESLYQEIVHPDRKTAQLA